jgi:hypothetical protein
LNQNFALTYSIFAALPFTGSLGGGAHRENLDEL